MDDDDRARIIGIIEGARACQRDLRSSVNLEIVLERLGMLVWPDDHGKDQL